MASEDSDRDRAWACTGSSSQRSRRSQGDRRPSCDGLPQRVRHTAANFSKLICFELRIGCVRKNGIEPSPTASDRLTARRIETACRFAMRCRTRLFAIRPGRRPEYSRQIVEGSGRSCAPCRDHELVSDLTTRACSRPFRTVMLPNEADGEAPLLRLRSRSPQPRNSISLSCWFSAPDTLSLRYTPGRTAPLSSAGYTGFPAYSQMHTASLPTRGQRWTEDAAHVVFGHGYLRTVIVTAAVYRGFNSVLRLSLRIS